MEYRTAEYARESHGSGTLDFLLQRIMEATKVGVHDIAWFILEDGCLSGFKCGVSSVFRWSPAIGERLVELGYNVNHDLTKSKITITWGE